ncbi:MAG: DEAD/DEAH box helicase [Oscillospiraceae bacterium]|jgi:hypothetical protein|nr:DEAD/DEAH box helicase [Oscillospiraceae bacterium]
MIFKPFSYQAFATDFLLTRNAAGLLLDMGMGKTIITLTAIAALLYDFFTVNRVLIIAPLQPARNVWSQEIDKWDHLQELTHSTAIGDVDTRIAAIKAKTDICIINVDNVAWLVNWLKSSKIPWPFDMLVIDELSCFKSPSSQRFRALRRVRKRIEHVVGLTGTPAPNGLIDLWAQMYLLDGGQALGKTISGYREQYFKVTQYANGYPVRWAPKPGAEAEIYSRLENLCISMQSADYLDLPERLDVMHTVELGDATQAQYQQLKQELLLPLANGYIDAGSAAIAANKLLQFTGGAVYDSDGMVHGIHRAKLDALQELVDEANGQPLLVFYGYKHELARLKAAYPEAVEVKEPGAVERWNRGEIPILLAHPASAGHGLNLQAGGHIAVWYSLPWSLELYQQANKRLHRLGQKFTVLIHHLIAKGTIDERIMRLLSGKELTQTALIDALKAEMEEYVA